MEATGYLLKNAQSQLRAAMDAALRDEGITTPQYAVLTFLEESPGLSSAQLARRAFVTPQTMSRIVANLEAGGLIERDASPDAGRALDARLSRHGRSLMEECHRRVGEVEACMVADLTPAERRELADLLQRCVQNLLRARAHASRASARLPVENSSPT